LRFVNFQTLRVLFFVDNKVIKQNIHFKNDPVTAFFYIIFNAPCGAPPFFCVFYDFCRLRKKLFSCVSLIFKRSAFYSL